ncbi:MAG TPA: hypothetical protein VIG74_00215 [Alphaproteobacteria bacterium]
MTAKIAGLAIAAFVMATAVTDAGAVLDKDRDSCGCAAPEPDSEAAFISPPISTPEWRPGR